MTRQVEHHGSAHGASGGRRIGWAFVIIFAFMLVEAGGGIIAGSLALLADAGHMVSDAAALAMSWLAIHIAKRPADAARSFGYRRMEVLAAFVNGCLLIVIAGWIVFEAAMRLAAPPPVLGSTMLIVALVGLAANLVALVILHGSDRQSLNLRSAGLHVLSDILGFIAAVIAALVILATRWYPIDPVLSLLVALLILRSAWQIVAESAHILLEGTPSELDADIVASDLVASVPGIGDVHHVHIWSLAAGQTHVTLHARCTDEARQAGITASINDRLRNKFGVSHSTIQIDSQVCLDEDCKLRQDFRDTVPSALVDKKGPLLQRGANVNPASASPFGLRSA